MNATTCMLLASLLPLGASTNQLPRLPDQPTALIATANQSEAPVRSVKTVTVWVHGRVGDDKWSHKNVPFTIKRILFRSSTLKCGFKSDGVGTNTLSVRAVTQGIVGTHYSGTVTYDLIY